MAENNKNLIFKSEMEEALIELYMKSPAMDDKELYNFVLDKIVQLTQSSIGFFHLVSDDQKTVYLTTWNGEAMDSCKAPKIGHYPLTEAGNWVDCVRQKKPIIYNDFPNSPNQKGMPQGYVSLKRFMSIPVIEDDKVRIIFGVGNKPEDYTENDTTKIQIFANTLQNIIKQRSAQNELKEKIQELERMNKFMTGRELKMVKLKEEIEKLNKQLGKK
ncbi:MAG: hypothetical protein BWY53_00748 [Parcubacteria group bacterium ADurb.Bin326]|nr:MAG: hypothetical protein BWY53_00748 [Parcubacteria group bacterium ADurb.Bin326]